LFDALASFRLAHPGVEISLFEDNSDRLTERVRAGMTDLALIGAAGGPPQGLDAMTIISEPLVAAVPAGHPVAKRIRVALANLSEFPIVCMPEGTGIRRVKSPVAAISRIVAVMTHNTDISDSWEREADDPRFFQQFAPDGYALGVEHHFRMGRLAQAVLLVHAELSQTQEFLLK